MSSDTTCFDKPIDITYVQRTPKDLEGTYRCTGVAQPGVPLVLSAATEIGIHVKDLSRIYEAKFTVPATDFEGSYAGFTYRFTLTDANTLNAVIPDGSVLSCSNK